VNILVRLYDIVIQCEEIKKNNNMIGICEKEEGKKEEK